MGVSPGPRRIRVPGVFLGFQLFKVRAQPVALSLGGAPVLVRLAPPSLGLAPARFVAASSELGLALQLLVLRALLSRAPELVLEAREALVRRVGLLLRLEELPSRFREALAHFLRSLLRLCRRLALTRAFGLCPGQRRRVRDRSSSRYRRGRAGPAAPKHLVARLHQVREITCKLRPHVVGQHVPAPRLERRFKGDALRKRPPA